ncbi:hypothetical protein IFM89_029643, partial [Coptis chinensis]
VFTLFLFLFLFYLQSNLISTSTILEYDLGAEGDLFKAPEPIIEEPVVVFDPVASAISMISCGEGVMSPETMKSGDIGSMQNESLLSEVFYECKKDLLANSAMKESFNEAEITLPALQMEEALNPEKFCFVSQRSVYKSVSSGCLPSMEWILASAARPNFLDFQVDFETVYGMHYSEGDMQIYKLIDEDCPETSMFKVGPHRCMRLIFTRLSALETPTLSILPLSDPLVSGTMPLKNACKSFLDKGRGRQRGILAGRSR